MNYFLNPNEARVIDLLRAMKSQKAGRGFGDLIVEVRDGIETLFKPHYSEQAPMRKVSA